MAFMDTLQGLLDTGVDVYKSTTAPAATQNPAANSNANLKSSSSSDWQQYIPWIIGAGVVLLLVLVFAGRRR